MIEVHIPDGQSRSLVERRRMSGADSIASTGQSILFGGNKTQSIPLATVSGHLGLEKEPVMAVGLRPFARWTIAAGILTGVGLGLTSSSASGRKRLGERGAARVFPRMAPAPVQTSDADRVSGAVRFSLLYVLPPIWLAASLADWACHRYSRIEYTAGVKESVIHLLLLGEMGVPVLATLFLEITSPIIMMMIAAFLVHEATVYADLRIAVSKREITPTEQMVHSFMEMMPLIGVWLVSVLREDELRALLGTSPRSPDFSLRPKEQPLPLGYRAGLLTAITLFGAIPYIEELWRTTSVAIARTRAIR